MLINCSLILNQEGIQMTRKNSRRVSSIGFSEGLRLINFFYYILMIEQLLRKLIAHQTAGTVQK